jgi:hypothetical protein
LGFISSFTRPAMIIPRWGSSQVSALTTHRRLPRLSQTRAPSEATSSPPAAVNASRSAIISPAKSHRSPGHRPPSRCQIRLPGGGGAVPPRKRQPAAAVPSTSPHQPTDCPPKMRFTSYCISFLLSHHWPPPRQPLMPGHALLGRDEGCASRNHRALKVEAAGMPPRKRSKPAWALGASCEIVDIAASPDRDLWRESLRFTIPFPSFNPKKMLRGQLGI